MPKTTTAARAGRSAQLRQEILQHRAAERRRERDAVVMAVLATVPLATYALARSGMSRLEAVGIVGFASILLLAWRRGAAERDREEAGRWGAGAAGERSTAAVLDALDRKRFAVFHDVRVPGRRENIDHVVIGRGGVVVVETKRWAGVTVVGRHVRVDGERRDDVRSQVERLRATLGRAVGSGVDGFVCIHGSRVRRAWFRRRCELDGVRYGGPDDLVRWLKRRRRTLTPAEAEELAWAVAGFDLESSRTDS
ncbi:MAG TPA: NERD domain-containing protein [Acidimicrobiales bacterium]|jgi:hypothetical protein|nr:NERD domain-containing protein [Acidimicrobiales bacterium]